jgi:hypothetical protein
MPLRAEEQTTNLNPATAATSRTGDSTPAKAAARVSCIWMGPAGRGSRSRGGLLGGVRLRATRYYVSEPAISRQSRSPAAKSAGVVGGAGRRSAAPISRTGRHAGRRRWWSRRSAANLAHRPSSRLTISQKLQMVAVFNPEIAMKANVESVGSTSWAQTEFGSAEMGHLARTKRLVSIAVGRGDPCRLVRQVN